MPLWPVSQRYMDTLARSHDQVSYVEIIRDGVTIAAVQSGIVIDPDSGNQLYAIGGQVTVSNSTVRRSGSVSFADPSGVLMPRHPDDLLAPYVTELRCWVGVKYWDANDAIFGGAVWQQAPTVTGGGSSGAYGSGFYGTGLYSTGQQTLQNIINGSTGDTIELVPLATLVITDPVVSSHQITLQGYDRMWLLANFAQQYTIPAGTSVTDALTLLLTMCVPTSRLSYVWLATEETVGLLTFDADTAVADALLRIASAAGQIVAVDPMGTFYTYIPPSTDDDPDLVLDTGQFSIMMHPESSIGTTDGPYNAVVYTNEGGNYPPARGYAQDNNDQSLTAVSRIGVRPKFMSSPILATKDACNKAARTALIHTLGMSDTTTLLMLPNHALDTDVVVEVTDESQAIYQMNVIVDNFTIPFRATDGIMTVACRTNVSAT